MMPVSLIWGTKLFGIIFFSLSVFSSCTIKPAQSDLSKQVRKMFPDLTRLSPPAYNRLLIKIPNEAELTLGRMLFNDPILSRNNDSSCGTCHLSNHGFADGLGLSMGTLGAGGPNGDTVGRTFAKGVLSLNRGFGDDGFGFFSSELMFRNAISTVNVVYRMDQSNIEGLFWDGRFGALDFQSLLPIHTSIELCGQNPIPVKGPHAGIFDENGVLFREPVQVTLSHSYDPVDGRDTGFFNSRPQLINGLPRKRPNGLPSVPTRNECLAIAIAKIRGIPAYRDLFKQAYGVDKIEDTHLAQALATFMMTHVALDTPYDRFVSGEETLSNKQLLGLAVFMTPLGNAFTLNGKSYQGAGCADCHAPPEFGGKGFASLGVISDIRSPLSRPNRIADLDHGFFTRDRLQRGKENNCHITNISVTEKYAPDIGRAGATHEKDDCFKFRVPPLRNVIETYPYFHHGTARGQGVQSEDLEVRSLAALRQVIDYHLRGPVDSSFVSRVNLNSVFFDETYQKDHFVPFYAQNFSKSPLRQDTLFPFKLSEEEKDALVDFVAYGLFDRNATKIGALNNDVSHPRTVPSGFSPSITRDEGHQGEIPPNFEMK